MVSKFLKYLLSIIIIIYFSIDCYASDSANKEERRKQETEELQECFDWWPTDATPGPVKDPKLKRWVAATAGNIFMS